jgi:hypothetical protein
MTDKKSKDPKVEERLKRLHQIRLRQVKSSRLYVFLNITQLIKI